jgi:hypothetical protein
MNDQCIHILKTGKRKGERCNRNAWFPFFYKCFCKCHAEMYNVPITPQEVNDFIQQKR